MLDAGTHMQESVKEAPWKDVLVPAFPIASFPSLTQRFGETGRSNASGTPGYVSVYGSRAPGLEAGWPMQAS